MTPINFNNPDLSDRDIADIATLGCKDRFVSIFSGKEVISLPDIGTLFVGFSDPTKLREEFDLFDFAVRESNDTVWWSDTDIAKSGPIARRFGMFPSNSQAAKNGFNHDILPGFNQISLRVNKMRSVLTIIRKCP